MNFEPLTVPVFVDSIDTYNIININCLDITRYIDFVAHVLQVREKKMIDG